MLYLNLALLCLWYHNEKNQPWQACWSQENESHVKQRQPT